MDRRDYAYPFRIDAFSRQGAQSGYEAHVEQMIRQILLTAPGERVDMPDFGCGLRKLLFAPHSAPLDATTQLLVQQALGRWLAGQIEVRKVTVVTPYTSGMEQVDGGADMSKFEIHIEYVLVETRTSKQLQVAVF